MKVAHIGPALARQGGPAGYLYQLQRAAAEAGEIGDVCFPPPVARRPAGAVSPSVSRLVRARLGSVKRAVFGAKAPARPTTADLGVDRGHVETVMQEARASIVCDAEASLNAAFASRPDVFFCHDTAPAEHVLSRRARDQRVWLLVHNPMPLALYLVWNWGIPDHDWRDVMALPDVGRWSRWEFDVWASVDCLLLPCHEALDEVARIDPSVRAIGTRVEYILSGASADAAAVSSERVDRAELRRRWNLPVDRPVGLYLGNFQAYRGFDALAAAAVRIPDSAPPGVVAIAGPPVDRVPQHPRLCALGHVSAVADLMAAVDFVINVNRFSLFDLSTIEALEGGKPLLLHAVGGNNTFKALGAGAEMLTDLGPSTIVDGLTRMFAMSMENSGALGAKSRACYEGHLTRRHLWSRHRALYAHPPALASAS